LYHYTYEITHNLSGMRYIGVRTCKVSPDCDNSYWGSSKYVPKDIKKTGTKVILQTFSKRENAVLHEIALHSLYDVARDEKFWNRSKQTSTGFDTSGTKLTKEQKVRCGDSNRGRTFTEEHRNNISKGRTGLKHSEEVCEIFSKAQLKYTNSEGYIHPNQGKVFTEEEKLKSSKARKKAYKKALIGSSKAKLAPRFKPWFISHPTYTEVMYDVTQIEYAEKSGITRATIVNALQRSKGIKRLSSRGTFKNCIMGYIP
jgi:hypothetical protein